MKEFLTPPKIAEILGVKPSKVIAWIRVGELAAIDVSAKRGGRARWRITQSAFDAFQAARSNRSALTKPRRRRRAQAAVIEFF